MTYASSSIFLNSSYTDALKTIKQIIDSWKHHGDLINDYNKYHRCKTVLT